MEATLAAVARTAFGKNESRRLRATGQIPAVVYGSSRGAGQSEATSIAVDPKALLRILHSDSGANTLIALKLPDGETRVLVKEYQLDPIDHKLLHADFFKVAMDRVITVTVPVTITGEAPGVKLQGGLLDWVQRQVEIECLPGDIPEGIEVDVSGLMLNQGVRLRDVTTNVKWTPITDPDAMLVHVVTAKVEEEPVVEAAATPAAPAEPEVLKKGKVEKADE